MNFDDPNLYSDLEDDITSEDIIVKNPRFCKYVVIILLIILTILIIHWCVCYKNEYDNDYVYNFGPDVKFNKVLN
jgi:hypothetical protein